MHFFTLTLLFHPRNLDQSKSTKPKRSRISTAVPNAGFVVDEYTVSPFSFGPNQTNG